MKEFLQARLNETKLFRIAKLVVFASILLLILIQLSGLLYLHFHSKIFKSFQKPSDILVDSYFYFTYVENLAEMRFYSWNGLYPSNGFHPLWAIILVPAAWLTNTKVALINTVNIYQVLIFF